MVAEDPPARVCVTVVDDEPLALDVLVRAARSWQYECQAAGSAEQALALLERNPTPILVTDLRMPGRGGLWLVQEVRRRWPQVGVIVLTGGHDSDSATESLRAGAHHYFLKPINLDEFRHVLEAAWRTYRLGQENDSYRRGLESAVRRQTRRVRNTYLSAITSLARAVEERDPYTAGHSRRVRRYALKLADALGLDRRQHKLLALSAQLHDIGKVGVPDAILHKPSALTAEEVAVVRQHPVIGERILAPVVRSRPVLAAIRAHHERLDGTGYPDGLRGEAIPLLGRVIAVCDCFDALTSARAYRGPLGLAEALAVLRAGAGAQFEPAFVEAFVALVPELRAEGARP